MSEEDTPANRLNEVIARFQTIREPLRRNRKQRRKAFLDTVLDGLKARTEAKTTRSEVLSVEDVIKENERLRRQLKKEKQEEEDSGFAGMGVRKTKDGKEIAIEF